MVCCVRAARRWLATAVKNYLDQEGSHARKRRKPPLQRHRGTLPVCEKPSYSYDNQAVREESGAKLRSYWILGPDSSGVPHPAVLLKELVGRCILLGSQSGDVILDPLSGSGTSGIVAAQLSRRASLVELNPVYAQQSRARISQDLQLTMIP